MTGAPVESLDILMKTCRQWLSFIVLRHLDELQKAQFRILERLFEKITKLKSYLNFNETYKHNYIYIYIVICIFIIIIIIIRCELGYHIVFPFSKHSAIFFWRILSIANFI